MHSIRLALEAAHMSAAVPYALLGCTSGAMNASVPGQLSARPAATSSSRSAGLRGRAVQSASGVSFWGGIRIALGCMLPADDGHWNAALRDQNPNRLDRCPVDASRGRSRQASRGRRSRVARSRASGPGRARPGRESWRARAARPPRSAGPGQALSPETWTHARMDRMRCGEQFKGAKTLRSPNSTSLQRKKTRRRAQTPAHAPRAAADRGGSYGKIHISILSEPKCTSPAVVRDWYNPSTRESSRRCMFRSQRQSSIRRTYPVTPIW